MQIIKSKSPNKSDEFNNKPLWGNGMNGFRKQFCNVIESSFAPFSLPMNHILPTRIMRTPGVFFTSRPQTNTIIGEHFFQVIIGISGIRHDFTVLGKIQGHLSESVQVMSTCGSASVFYRNTISSYVTCTLNP